jgi:hypothetical protein
LFILTLGVIGILTMFPLGAAQMARAVRDDRSALAASNADGFMRWYWQNYVVPQINPPFNFPYTQDPNLTAGSGLFDSPPGLPSLVQNNPNQLVFQNAGQLSYPVVVDPMGFFARGAVFGEAPSTQIQRCTLQGLQNQPTLNGLIPQPQLSVYPYRMCSLVDSLGYNDNGTPNGDLEMRYNWLWVLQRAQFINEQNEINVNSSPNLNLYTANMTVVVFDRRAFGYPPSSVLGFEVVIPNVPMTSGLTSVTIPQASSLQALDLKPGSWIMDATINANVQPPIRQANFYRVVSVVQAGTQVTLELQTPIAPPTGQPPLGFSYTGTLVALRGVSGVFVRPQLTPY